MGEENQNTFSIGRGTMGVRTVHSGAADKPQMPTLVASLQTLPQWILQEWLTNSKVGYPSMLAATLSNSMQTIMAQLKHYQERSCGSKAECRHILPETPPDTTQCSVLHSSESIPKQTHPECPHTADQLCMDAPILHPWTHLQCDKRKEMPQMGKQSLHIFMEH